MNLITWSDSLSVKVPSIDAQHQKLINLINALNNAMLQGKGKEVLGTILLDLVQYTKTHFAYEESVMHKAGYAKLDEHKAEHRKLTGQVEQLVKDYETGKVGISVSLMSFLTDWLRSHIIGRDADYIATLQAKNIQ